MHIFKNYEKLIINYILNFISINLKIKILIKSYVEIIYVFFKLNTEAISHTNYVNQNSYFSSLFSIVYKKTFFINQLLI